MSTNQQYMLTDSYFRPRTLKNILKGASLHEPGAFKQPRCPWNPCILLVFVRDRLLPCARTCLPCFSRIYRLLQPTQIVCI
eukprot:jgi/Mesvir1/997/Mv25686-RA.1